ncbi:unnamed protein product [Rangifer tarandus platyrhynchus]|uniref:Uncharacterized protein n=2 Tax=Rangifer tarandus platyrhynchus TaxID=3082113 RepID=A0AC59Y703_RANTA|nr:unnamed protein product [Rangifer tarandus platyrhynchus]
MSVMAAGSGDEDPKGKHTAGVRRGQEGKAPGRGQTPRDCEGRAEASPGERGAGGCSARRPAPGFRARAESWRRAGRGGATANREGRAAGRLGSSANRQAVNWN